MSSGFITENEIADARKKRQEEWEKVRKPDDPLERPEEPYDSRSLYDRLQEQKQKKDLEYEEAHKLKNMIKGLDDDEIEFLDLVDRTKLAADRKKNLEEEQELNDYRNRVASLQEKVLDEKLQVNVTKPKVASGKNSLQTKLLKGAVVKKDTFKKRKASETDENSEDEKNKQSSKSVKIDGEKETENKNSANVGLRCIGILPGLGCYTDSSSDEASSSESDTDLISPILTKNDKGD